MSERERENFILNVLGCLGNILGANCTKLNSNCCEQNWLAIERFSLD